MFELVKLIVETISKFLDPKSITTLIRDKKKRELGTELFLLYANLNEILATGDSIVSSLEAYCERMERHLSHNDDSYALTGGSWVEKSLLLQRINLAKFGKTMQRLSCELQILDGDSYRALRPLLNGKVNALDSLLRNLGQGKLPVQGPTIATLRKLTEQREEADEYERREGIDTILLLIRSEFESGSISSRESWDERIYLIVKSYLSTRNPRAQLEEISTVARQIKATLEKNFSISDVLLDVRDRRLEPCGIAEDYFW